MYTSLAMVIALSKKYASSVSVDVDIEGVKGLKEELDKKIDSIDITSDGINFKGNDVTIKKLEFINDEDISNIIKNL